MTAAKKFVSQEQHEALRLEVRSNATVVERLSVRVEVISHDTTRILREMADLREEVSERFDAVDARFDAVDARFKTVDGRLGSLERELTQTREEILKVVNDGHAALLSAIMQLGKR